MDGLSTLFKEASKDIKEEEATATELKEKIEPLINKIDTLEDENKKIAQGILTIADMIKEVEEKLERPMAPKPAMMHPRPMPRGIRMPRPGPIPPRSPRGMMPPPMPTVKKMPTPSPRPPMPEFPGRPPRPEAPRMPPPPTAPLGPPPMPPRMPPPLPPQGMPSPTELPPPLGMLPPKKKGFLARLLGK